MYSGAAKTIEEGLQAFAAKRFPPKPQPEAEEGAEEGEEGWEEEAADDVTGGFGLPPPQGQASSQQQLQGMTSALTAASLARSGGGLAGRLYASWRFLMRAMERSLGEPASIPKVHKLSYVIIALPGVSHPEGEFPIVQIYQVRRPTEAIH